MELNEMIELACPAPVHMNRIKSNLVWMSAIGEQNDDGVDGRQPEQ
jgi:hypothetical protein